MRAQAPAGGREALWASALSDLPSWWADGGAAGWSAGAWLGASAPWTLAGHVAGTWTLSEPRRAPQGLPGPGVRGMLTPIVWNDSVVVSLLAGSAWHGWGGTLARGEGWNPEPGAPGAHAVVDLRSGSFGFDENAITLERGDSTRWLRGEAVSGSRRAAEALDLMGRHLWGLAAGGQRGAHRVEATFSQRAASSSLFGGEEQSAEGQSGHLEYGLAQPWGKVALRFERGLDRHRSLGALTSSVRDGEEDGVSATAAGLRGSLGWAVRGDWRRAHVLRKRPDGVPDSEGFDRGTSWGWGAARLERPLGEGRARVELGAGRQVALDRVEVAPSLGYQLRIRGLDARVGFDRVLAPVWSDLDANVAPFLQRTWAGVVELAASGGASRSARATLLMGRTTDRAIVARLPLEELWLRLGTFPDPEPYDFALLSWTAQWEASRFAAGSDGFLLARDQSAAQPSVDPGEGIRAWVSARMRFFEGGLGVTVRSDAEWIGSRESQGGLPELCGDASFLPPRTLPGHATLGASALLSLARALVTLRVRNLEGTRREDVWVDCGTLSEARTPGREWRLAFTLRLAN